MQTCKCTWQTRAGRGHQPALQLVPCSVTARPTVLTHAAKVTWDAPNAVVVGAGIGGLATALALHKVGIPVTVLEQSGKGLRGAEGSAIGIWENAWCALDQLGIADELREKFLPLNRVELCRSTGRLLRSFHFNETTAGSRPPRRRPASSGNHQSSAPGTMQSGSEFRGVRRADLIQALADALAPGTIQGDAAVKSISIPEPDKSTGGDVSQSHWPVAVLSNGQRVEAGLLVGADGVRSVVAGQLGLGLPLPQYAGYTAYRGVATVPDLSSLDLPDNTIRQIWGQGVRAGLYPMTNQQVYWFTCFNANEGAAVPSSPAANKAEALSQVQGWSWHVAEAIQATPPEAVSRSRIVERWTGAPVGKGLVTLCGDAAHPMTPNLGQGGCTAVEDAVVLARYVADSLTQQGAVLPFKVEDALRQYEKERATRCLPLTVRSSIMGTLLQLPYDPVCMVRDEFVANLFSPSHFLDHTTYDCGKLPVGAVQARMPATVMQA